MRIAIMGSGAVGSYVGGVLARAGAEVTFIARGAHLDALRRRGLTVRSRTTGNFTIPVTATYDPAQAGVVDLVLFCVKTFDLDAAAAEMQPLIGPQTMVLPLQNGIDNARRLARYVRLRNLLGGVAYLIVARTAPGVVTHYGLNRIVVGELGGETSRRTSFVRDAFGHTAVTAEVHSDISVPMWEKFVVLAGAGGVMAMTRLTFGQVLASTEASALYRGVLDEAAAVGRAMGVPLRDDLVDRHWQVLAQVDPCARGAMCHDLLAGRRLEIESLNGAVVRLGRDKGIPTPLNFAVYAALKPFAAGTRAR